MATLTVPASQTEIIGRKNAPADGTYGEVVLGQQSRLVVDGAELVLNGLVLERSGTRTIELINGATVRLGELAFAGLGAGIVYRIGSGCTLVFDANLSEPEVVAMTTVAFSGAGARLRYAPFSNPRWRQKPRITGYGSGDVIEHLDGGRMEVANGRPVMPAVAA